MIRLESYEIVDRLIELKELKGWSYYRIAKESHLPESTVSHIYKRKSLPQIDTLLLLCKGFGISVAEFFGYDEKYNQLSDNEKEILRLWNSLNSENQQFVKEFILKLNNR